MKKLAIIPLFLFLFVQVPQLRAQDFFVNADLVSSFMWRGMKCNDVSFQPSVGFDAGGFTFFAWGSTDLNSFDSQADFFLNYKYKGFKIELANYFTLPSDGPASSYFDFKAKSTEHMFDVVASYQFSGKLPFILTWSTIFAGNDYNEEARINRSYSSYFEIAYPFSIKDFDLQAEIGMTPWKGMYNMESEKLNVVNLGVSVAKKLKITDSFSLPVFGKVVVNPVVEQIYVVFGLSL